MTWGDVIKPAFARAVAGADAGLCRGEGVSDPAFGDDGRAAASSFTLGRRRGAPSRRAAPPRTKNGGAT